MDSEERRRFEIYASLCVATSALSIVGCIFIVVNYVIAAAKLKQYGIATIVPLALADLFAALGVFVGAILWLTTHQNVETGTCLYIGAWMQMFYCASFLWTAAFAIDTYLNLKSEEDFTSRTSRWVLRHKNQVYHVVCWGVPAATAVVLLVIGNAGDLSTDRNVSWCLLNPEDFSLVRVLLMYAPLFVVMIFNCVAYIATSRKLHGLLQVSGIYTQRERDLSVKVRRKLTLYLSIFVVCWITGLVNGFIGLAQHIDMAGQLFPLFIAQALTNPSQGFLNAIAYGYNTVLRTSVAGCFGWKRLEKETPHSPRRRRAESHSRALSPRPPRDEQGPLIDAG